MGAKREGANGVECTDACGSLNARPRCHVAELYSVPDAGQRLVVKMNKTRYRTSSFKKTRTLTPIAGDTTRSRMAYTHTHSHTLGALGVHQECGVIFLYSKLAFCKGVLFGRINFSPPTTCSTCRPTPPIYPCARRLSRPCTSITRRLLRLRLRLRRPPLPHACRLYQTARRTLRAG